MSGHSYVLAVRAAERECSELRRTIVEAAAVQRALAKLAKQTNGLIKEIGRTIEQAYEALDELEARLVIVRAEEPATEEASCAG